MKGLMILANGFEDSEAITTIDIIRRAEIKLVLASANNTLDLITQSNIKVSAEVLLSSVNYKDYDFLIIPGGKAVMQTLDKMPSVTDAIKCFYNSNKLCCFICAAPMLIGKLGLLEGHNYTCFPGMGKYITLGQNKPLSGVVTSKNIITAKSMGYSLEFGIAIVASLLGSDKANEVLNQIKGN